MQLFQLEREGGATWYEPYMDGKLQKEIVSELRKWETRENEIISPLNASNNNTHHSPCTNLGHWVIILGEI